MADPQITAGARLPLTRKLHFDRDANNTLTYNGVTFTTPITLEGTTFHPSITLTYRDTWFSCKNFTDLGCKEKCPTRTSYDGKEIAYGCVVTANATLVGTDDTVLVKDFKAGFAQGRFQDGVADNDANNLGTDGLLGLGASSYMPDWKNTYRDDIREFADSFSLSLASDNAFLMFNGVDDALIAKNVWTPITLPLASKYGSWRIGMTAFQVDGLADASAALFPCMSTWQAEEMPGTCESYLNLGLTYIMMPKFIFEAFEEKYLAKSSGCKKSLSFRQKYYSTNKMYVCPSTVTLPRMAFTFGSATFYLDSKDYVTPKEDEADKVVVELLGDSNWNLGAPFAQKFYASYRKRANVTVYCRMGKHCALNVVVNPVPPPKGDSTREWYAFRDRARAYFGINTTDSSSSGSSGKKKTSTTDNEELKPPSPKTRNTIVVIAVVLAFLVMAASAFYRHRKRKQRAAKMAANDAAISTPVASSPVPVSADTAPYQIEPSTIAAK